MDKITDGETVFYPMVYAPELSLSDVIARFDELYEKETGERLPPLLIDSDMPPVEVPPGGWPDEQPEGLPPGHWAPEAFGTEEEAKTFIEDEDTVAFAFVLPGEDGYWYVYYVDNTDLL
jgi:hypothetical protein